MPRSTAAAHRDRRHAALEADRHAALEADRRPVLLDTNQTADLLRLQPSTCEQWRYTGKGPRFVKVGSRVFYRLSDVEDWLNEQTRTSTSDAGIDEGEEPARAERPADRRGQEGLHPGGGRSKPGDD